MSMWKWRVGERKAHKQEARRSVKRAETRRNAEGASQAEKITKGYGVQADVSVLQLNNATANTAATGNKRYVWQMRNYNWWKCEEDSGKRKRVWQ